MSEQSPVGRQLLFRVFFFAVLLFLLLQLGRIFAPFFGSLAAAATLVLICHPAHVRIQRWVGGRSSLAAGVSTLALLLIVILPVVGLTWLLVAELSEVLPAVRAWADAVKEGGPGSWREALPPRTRGLVSELEYFLLDWGLDLQELVLSGLERAGRAASGFAASFVKNLFMVAFDIILVVVGVFFFFRDGARMVHGILDYVPMEQVYKDQVVRRTGQTLSAVVRGVFVTAAVQGILAGIGFGLAGLRFAVLAGFATAICALIPFVGAAMIWIPGAAWLLLTGHLGPGVFLALWGVLVVSLADNILKPLLIGGRVQISTFLLFFGILGGIDVYGVLGILIGPLMIALVLTFLRIYREEFNPTAIVIPTPEPVRPPAPSAPL